MVIDAAILKQIQLLNRQGLDELSRFLQILLKKQEDFGVRKTKDTKSPKLLSGLKKIAIPVNHIIIDRAALYEDRI